MLMTIRSPIYRAQRNAITTADGADAFKKLFQQSIHCSDDTYADKYSSGVIDANQKKNYIRRHNKNPA